jgi:hypothetical protein
MAQWLAECTRSATASVSDADGMYLSCDFRKDVRKSNVSKEESIEGEQRWLSVAAA